MNRSSGLFFFSSGWKGENTKRCTRNGQGSSWRKRKVKKKNKQTTKQTGRRGNIRKNNRTGSEAIWIRSGRFEDSGRTCLRKQKFRTRREVRCVLNSSLGMKQGAEYSEAKGSGSRNLHTRPRQKSRTGQIPHLSNGAQIIQKLSWMNEWMNVIVRCLVTGTESQPLNMLHASLLWSTQITRVTEKQVGLKQNSRCCCPF